MVQVDKDKLVEHINSIANMFYEKGDTLISGLFVILRDDIESGTFDIEPKTTPRPIDEWHEDIGDALWWSFPIQEPPYCGSPLDADWPDYHTHWTPIIIPEQPIGDGQL